jgi:hypothetical protein
MPAISKVADDQLPDGAITVGPFSNRGTQYSIAHDMSPATDGAPRLKETQWTSGQALVAAFANRLDSELARTLRDAITLALRRIGVPGLIIATPPVIDPDPIASTAEQPETVISEHVLPDSVIAIRDYLSRFDVPAQGARVPRTLAAHRASHPLVIRLSPGEAGQALDLNPRIHLNALISRYDKLTHPDIKELSKREIAALTECVLDALHVIFTVLAARVQ